MSNDLRFLVQRDILVDMGYTYEQAKHFMNSSQKKVRCLQNFKQYGTLCGDGNITKEDLDYLNVGEK